MAKALLPTNAKIAVKSWLRRRSWRTAKIPTEDVNIDVTINSTLLPIRIATSKMMEVIPINPIRASNMIVSTIAATVIGIKYSDNASFWVNKYARLTSIVNMSASNSTIFQSSKMVVR